MNLRTDISKEERAEALKICKDVLDTYADGTYDQKFKQKNGGIHIGGIFDELDMTQAEKAVDTENEPKPQAELVIDEDELDFELDDFFKQGGLDVNDMKNPEETKEVKAGDINNENIDADLLHKLEQEKL